MQVKQGPELHDAVYLYRVQIWSEFVMPIGASVQVKTYDLAPSNREIVEEHFPSRM